MKTRSIDILCCPHCNGPLAVESGCENAVTVAEGALVCLKCGRGFPVKDGIVRFLEIEDMREADRRQENFRKRFYSHVYDISTLIEFAFCGGEKKARHECLDRLDVKPRSRILEIGIGTGSNLPYVSSSFQEGRFFGIDISASMIRYCRKKLDRWGCPAEIFIARAERLPFKEGSFDVVFQIGSINIFEDKRGAIEEMIRVSRPGTKVVIADETEKANRLRDSFILPRLLCKGREDSTPPIDLVPRTMHDIKLESIWNGYGYCVEFRLPA
jgi:ubiquinone/menaquinone biosynthesis C-methylase UbiE